MAGEQGFGQRSISATGQQRGPLHIAPCAIEMPRHERRKRMRSLRKRVAENDVAKWSDSFLTTLRQARRSRAAWGGSGLAGDVEWTVERPPSR